MDKQLEKIAIESVSSILDQFYCQRDIEGVLSYLSKEASWIGPGEKEVKLSYQEIKEYFLLGKDQIPYCEIVNEDLKIVYSGTDCCMVTGYATIRSTEQSKMLIEVNQRVSFLFHLIAGELKVMHMHLSNPYTDMMGEDYFPKAVGTQSYDYLQRLLNEKTEVINMINSNIDGGLKGSNDDSTFSFFYVNEGLPRMLGYTYEEFMEMSGGSAVGAVYPPDLPGALMAVDKAFSKGPVYSAEYRIKKKDGSLMWVMDSGRKMVDSNGLVRINSIIMDITPLKEALFDLEVERERYRIALENITDVMCEYDIQRDLYTTFQRIEIDGKVELEKFEIPNFSKAIDERNMVHPEDREEMLSLFSGKIHETIDVRTKQFHIGIGWRWSQIRCSVIYDSSHMPVKTIGMMKDVTDEKEKEIKLIQQAQYDGLTHLLNQTETKRYIQERLEQMGEMTDCMGAMMIVDLDRFKQVNDTRGHLFGNHVLIEAADVLKKNIEVGDLAGRVGGDEFLIFIRNGVKGQVICLAERILREIEDIGVKEEAEVSCSIGIVLFAYGSGNYEELFHKADDALYLAKRKGRRQWGMID